MRIAGKGRMFDEAVSGGMRRMGRMEGDVGEIAEG